MEFTFLERLKLYMRLKNVTHIWLAETLKIAPSTAVKRLNGTLKFHSFEEKYLIDIMNDDEMQRL